MVALIVCTFIVGIRIYYTINFRYKNTTQSALFFAYKNLTQSAFFLNKNGRPPPKISKFLKKSRNAVLVQAKLMVLNEESLSVTHFTITTFHHYTIPVHMIPISLSTINVNSTQ